MYLEPKSDLILMILQAPSPFEIGMSLGQDFNVASAPKVHSYYSILTCFTCHQSTKIAVIMLHQYTWQDRGNPKLLAKQEQKSLTCCIWTLWTITLISCTESLVYLNVIASSAEKQISLSMCFHMICALMQHSWQAHAHQLIATERRNRFISECNLYRSSLSLKHTTLWMLSLWQEIREPIA